MGFCQSGEDLADPIRHEESPTDLVLTSGRLYYAYTSAVFVMNR